jgi:hypothetical protein
MKISNGNISEITMRWELRERSALEMLRVKVKNCYEERKRKCNRMKQYNVMSGISSQSYSLDKTQIE